MHVEQFSARLRRIVLDISYTAHLGHIGSALSIADIVGLLYAKTLRATAPDDPDRDRFILSKGHAAAALYAALYLKGWISDEQLRSFGSDGTLLGVHPEHQLTGVEFSTGSLGQGLTYALGCALAGRLQESERRTFVLLSDAECDEGSVWEAALFAAHHHLSNLVAILDLNGQQALGYTRDVLDCSPLAQHWRAFDWDVHEVDGHDAAEMERTIANLNFTSGPPHILIAHTTFGKGVSFMESQIKWHYLPLSEEAYRQACSEVDFAR